MRRRRSPYSCIEQVRRSRAEVLTLVLITVVLGFLLGLLTNGVTGALQQALTPRAWSALLALAASLALLLTAAAIWLFHGRTESQWAHIDLWVPYHFPGRHRATIARGGAYQPPRHARRAFMRRYRPNGPDLDAFLREKADAEAKGKLFQDFIADDQLALTQCLALYVLHYYSERSLGPEAAYHWWKVDMDPRRLSMDDLPSPVRKNPFLRADQRAHEWRLLLPQGVGFEATETSWLLRHRWYGQVEVRWVPRLSVAGKHSQPYQALTSYMRLAKGSELHVVGTRIEAVARLHGTLLPTSEPFHRWATGLLARLEEALDFAYYIATRPDRIIRDLEWKIGWVPEGTSIVEMLQALEGRLEDLEMEAAAAALEETEDPGQSLVV